MKTKALVVAVLASAMFSAPTSAATYTISATSLDPVNWSSFIITFDDADNDSLFDFAELVSFDGVSDLDQGFNYGGDRRIQTLDTVLTV